MYRYDLLFTTTFCARLITRWTTLADKFLWQLFSYVSNTLQLELVGKVCVDDPRRWIVDAFADADLNGSPDCTRSTSGGTIIITSSTGTDFTLAAWSKKQGSTAVSTAEAEMVSLSHCIREHIYPLQSTIEDVFQRCHASVPASLPVRVWEDNAAVVAIIEAGYSPVMRYLLKHQRVCIGSLSEQFKTPNLVLLPIITSLQKSDLMTKGLVGGKLTSALEMIGLKFPPK
jgi:hypothetical protein